MMKLEIKSLRPFIGSKDMATSRSFYYDLGFEEDVISDDLCLFTCGSFCFYLQRYYSKEWLENTMLFMEVPDVKQCYESILQLKLEDTYLDVSVKPIKTWDWGSECYIIDPAGVLLHFGQFNRSAG